MKREEFINYLVKKNIPYSEYTENGADMVYVYNRREVELKKAHPRKYKDLFVTYLRVSHFDEDMLYTRDCGICGYMNEKEVMRKVRELGA